MFSPQLKTESKDVVANTLRTIAHATLIVLLGLSPLLFIPVAYAPFSYSKILFVIVGVAIALIFYSLSSLREGTLTIKLNPVLPMFWGVAAVVSLAAVFSGDLDDSFLGDVINIHTAAFVILLAIVASLVTILGDRKQSLLHLLTLLVSSGLIVALYQLVRIIFGADFLSLGVFNSLVGSPLGSWNDLALFFGLLLLLAMVAVEQFPLTRNGKLFFYATSALSLIVLAIVNFFAIWLVLGLVGLVVMMYALTKNRFSAEASSAAPDNTVVTVLLSVVVFVVSTTFVIGGPALGQTISNLTGVTYIEVRPSLSATTDIARAVYSDNAFTGIGPNRFNDAWRLHKDPAINNTQFWNTPFAAAVGYIPTFAVTAGILGIVAWLGFLATLVYAGLRFLFRSDRTDKMWQFIGTASFVGAVYLWGMALVYVPGVTMLTLAAVFTGLLALSYNQVNSVKQFTISISDNRQAGFVMVALTMVMIVGSVATLFFVGRGYASSYNFNQTVSSIAAGVPIATVEREIAAAFELSPNDIFAREIAGIQIAKLNTFLSQGELSDAERQEFQNTAVTAVNAAQLATEDDPTEPQNWLVLGSVYSLLALAGLEGADERAREAFTVASEYDPRNPQIVLAKAQLESRTGDLDSARQLALESIALKRNYTEAYQFLTQIDIARGDVASAIASAEANITLEPRNSARYYQLGVLYSSNEQLDSAIAAFETAVSLDPQYANARYFLALAYQQQGRSEEAISQLRVVAELNPNNQQLNSLISAIENGELSDEVVSQTPESVAEGETVSVDDGDVTTESDPDTSLLSPVNTVPAGEEESESATESAEEESAE